MNTWFEVIKGTAHCKSDFNSKNEKEKKTKQILNKKILGVKY